MHNKDSVKINEEIVVPQVRVIGSDGGQVGILSLQDALQMAWSQDLDLVEVSDSSVPPVCKIIDYGKYRYEQQKRANETKKRQKVVNVKEMILRPNIDVHDYQVKLKHIRGFIGKGDKVRVIMKFKGREISHQNLGEDVLKRLQADVQDIVEFEQLPKLDGKTIIMVIAPK